ncbi:MAG: S41 family peptidase, partial [Candidatus Aminicenantes bacterium]|nr:S41 family peptidase [Candidatus Aminicenantes bacterium]
MRQRIIILFMALAVLVELTPCMSENKEYLNTFEIVWKKVNETYFDPTFGGLNWKDVYDRYQPQIAAAEKNEEFYKLINKMLWELKVSHAYLVPPRSFALYEPLVFAEGSAGIDIRLINGEAVITSVKPESPANKAGLCPGYVIQAIDDISIEQIVQEAELIMPPPYNSRGRIARVTKAILSRIYGAPETEVSIAYSDEGGEEREKKVMRTKRSGAAVGPKGMFFLAVEFEARRLDNGIGYIRSNTLQPPLAAQILSAIKSMGNVSGIIFDLRGNSGGEIEKMPDLFLTERAFLYLKRARDSETKVFFDPVNDVYKGPLVLLIDVLSGSASEIFAACLQAIGRAVVVGERSPGSVMESDVMIFPNEAIFLYPVAQISTPDGTVLEGHGVVPDIEVG